MPNVWVGHLIEHQLSAFYDVTHGLGLAIILPKYLRSILNENTEDRFYNFGVNVWDIDKNLPKMEVATKAIECLENFAYKDLELTSNLKELNIDNRHFEEMANRICSKGLVEALVNMDKEKILNILNRCL